MWAECREEVCRMWAVYFGQFARCGLCAERKSAGCGLCTLDSLQDVGCVQRGSLQDVGCVLWTVCKMWAECREEVCRMRAVNKLQDVAGVSPPGPEL